MKYQINVEHVDVCANEPLTLEEAKAYLSYVKGKNPNRVVKSIQLDFDGEEVGVGYQLMPVNFEKIRRITGYLVGDMNRWNNSKSAEEKDRVKHA